MEDSREDLRASSVVEDLAEDSSWTSWAIWDAISVA